MANPTASQKPTPINPQELGRARQAWGFFAHYAKISAVFCALLVAFIIWIIQ